MADNAGAWAKFGRPEKCLRFSRAPEFGRARMAEPGPQGPQRGGGDAAATRMLSAVEHPVRRRRDFNTQVKDGWDVVKLDCVVV